MNREIRNILCRALEVYRLELEDKIKNIENIPIFTLHHINFRDVTWSSPYTDIFPAEIISEAESGQELLRELDIVNKPHKDFGD